TSSTHPSLRDLPPFPTRRSSDLEASRLQIDYMPLIKALFCEVNPIPVKKAMELLGWQVGDVRLPLVGVTAEHEALLRRELDKMRSEEHTSELQSRFDLVCRLLLE